MVLRLATANENGRSGMEFSLQAEPSANPSREVGTSAFGLSCLRAGKSLNSMPASEVRTGTRP